MYLTITAFCSIKLHEEKYIYKGKHYVPPICLGKK